MTTPSDSEMGTVLEWAARDHPPRTAPEGYEPAEAFLVPAGWKVEKAPWTPNRPKRIVGEVNLATAESFCRYFNDYHNPGAVILATIRDSQQYAPTFRAVLDYHEGPSSPNWCGHVATFTPMETPAWKAWLDIQKEPLTQEEFAEHLEENLPTVIRPEGAILLRVINDFSVEGKLTFSRATRLQDGTVKLLYATEHTARSGELLVPRTFTIQVPIYEGQPPVPIEAVLSYRISPTGDLTLSFDFRNLEAVFRLMTVQISDAIAEKTLQEPYWVR